MKLCFKLGEVKLNDPNSDLDVKVSGIEIETEYNLSEVKGVCDIQREILGNLPEIMTGVRNAVKTMRDIEKEDIEVREQFVHSARLNMDKTHNLNVAVSTAQGVLDKFRDSFMSHITNDTDSKVIGILKDVEGSLRGSVDKLKSQL